MVPGCADPVLVLVSCYGREIAIAVPERGARLGRAGRAEKSLGECGGYMESLRPGPGQEANFFLRLITWFGSASSTRGNEISHGGPPRAAGESKERGKERGVSPSFYG